MTQVREPLERPRSASLRRPPTTTGAGRGPIVAALVVALIACGATQQWASSWKDHNAGQQPQQAERGALGGMNSYALALMLGGLRGPLVMALWSKVENQKIDRDLEDVDTMIEWIRLLQPEFDTVHVFQIWNKAYNISVMMASNAAKYQIILDAIDYARRVDTDRPDDINILDELAQVFGDKLGGKNVSERKFYRRQFREDSLTPESRKRAYPEDVGHYHALGLKFFGPTNGPILDDHNNLDPRLLAPRYSRPSALAPDSEWNDGAELQYLKKYQPFPYGVEPTAMGYNYAKRAQVAMTVGGQRPLQIGDTVVDSRPALFLKQWAEIEADRGITYEALAFGVPNDAEPTVLEGKTIDARDITDARALNAAVYSYGMSVRLCSDSLVELQRHLGTQYVNAFQSYASQREDLKALTLLGSGDRDYLASFQAGADRSALLSAALSDYLQARKAYELMVLTYYVEDPVAQKLKLPNDRTELGKVSEDQLDRLYRQMIVEVAQLDLTQRGYEDQRNDYGHYVARADGRLRVMGYGQPSLLERH